MNYNEDQLKELEQQYRIMRQESEQPFDFLVSDIIVKLIDDVNTKPTSKLYLAMEYSDCLMEGTFEDCLGVFSQPNLAVKELSDRTWFQEADYTGENKWMYHYDGTMTKRWEVVEVTLDESIGKL